jgi:hypothetical protein
VVGVTAGSREVPGRKPVIRDNNDNNNNNNINAHGHGKLLFFLYLNAPVADSTVPLACLLMWTLLVKQ